MVNICTENCLGSTDQQSYIYISYSKEHHDTKGYGYGNMEFWDVLSRGLGSWSLLLLFIYTLLCFIP